MSHPCSSERHPQVPVSFVLLTAQWCHSCAAWTLAASAHIQHGDEAVPIEPYREWEFGPFDSLLEVEGCGAGAWAQLLLTPGRPWDQGSWG